MTSVLSSEMSTLLKSMFCLLLSTSRRPSCFKSCFTPWWRSVLGVVGGVGGPWGCPEKKRCKSEMKVCHFKHKIISRIKQISRKVHTCMVRMVVSVTHSSQSSHPWFSFVHVMSQFCSRIWVALAWFHILPSSRLVLVVWMIFLVLNSKPLCFIYEWPLFTLWKQAKVEK